MGYFYIDPRLTGDPDVASLLSPQRFRVLIEAACRYNRTRDPEDAPPAEFMHYFKFPKRSKSKRRKDKRHDRDALWQRFSGICYLCGEPADYGSFHVEHVVPLCRGGADDEANINVAHGACNRRKGTKLLSELDWGVCGG